MKVYIVLQYICTIEKCVVFMYLNYLVAVMAQKVIGHGIVFKLFQLYCDIEEKTVLKIM